MDDIAERAGVAKGSLYYNFRSKSAIFEDILATGISRLATRVEHAAATASTPLGALEAMVDEFLSSIHAQPDLAQVLLSEIFRTDREWRESIGVARQSIIQAFAHAATEYGATQDMTIDHPELLGAAIVGAALVTGIDWHLYHTDVPRHVVTNTILNGLQLPTN